MLPVGVSIPRRLRRLQGSAKTSPSEFEFKLAGLVALRARRRGLRFEMFSNVDAARPCDDLVLRVLAPRPALFFVQLKHCTGQQVAGTQAFVKKAGDFSVSKYFEFFEKLRLKHAQRSALDADDLWLTEVQLQDARFLIYTTTTVQRSARPGSPGPASQVANPGDPADELFATGAGGPRDVFCFDNGDKEVWDLLAGSGDREEIYRSEFLPRFKVFPCQSHADDLDSLILDEIQQVFGGGLPEPRARRFLDDFLAFLKPWAQDDAQDFGLTEATPQLLLEASLAAELRATAQTAARGLAFADGRCAQLRFELRTAVARVGAGGAGPLPLTLRVAVPGVPAGARAAKLCQALERDFPGRWGYVDAAAASKYSARALQAVARACRVLVLDVQSASSPSVELKQLANALRAGAPDVVLVELSAGGGAAVFADALCVDDSWTMDQLSEDAQEAMLDSIVEFQGDAVALRELEGAWPELRREVDGALLGALARGGGAARLGAAPPPAPEPQGVHVERALQHRSALDPAVLRLQTGYDHFALSGFLDPMLKELGRELKAGVCLRNLWWTALLDNADVEDVERLWKLRSDVYVQWIERVVHERLYDAALDWRNSRGARGAVNGFVRPATGEYVSDPLWTEMRGNVVLMDRQCLGPGGRRVYNVHWIARVGGESLEDVALEWRHSFGDTNAVVPFVRRATAECVREPVCVHAAAWCSGGAGLGAGLLVGEAGVGKSTFLRQAVAEARRRAPASWAVFVEVLAHRDLLRRLPPPAELTIAHAVELVAAAAGVATPASSGGESARRFLEAALFHSGAISIFVDGVDEISPFFKDKVLRILQLLQEIPIDALWVSSRPEVAASLCGALRCLPASLRALTPAQQESYLCEHWGAAHGVPAAQFARLAAEVAATLRASSPGLLDVPLHVKMAAEALEARAAEVLRSGGGVGGLLRQGWSSLSELYQFFVEQKRDLFMGRHWENLPHTDEFHERHQKCAMFVLLSGGSYDGVDIGPFQEYINSKVDVMRNENTGIMWVDESGLPRFVHYSFVEYFAAQWLAAHAGTETARSVLRGLFEGPADRNLLRAVLERSLLIVSRSEQQAAVGAEVARDVPRGSFEWPADRNLLRAVLERTLLEVGEGGRRLALHEAVLAGDEARLEAELAAALEQAGGGEGARAVVDAVDAGGRSALHLAAHRCLPGAVRRLLDAGCDPTRRDALLGWTPQDYVERSAAGCDPEKKRKVAEALQEAGASPETPSSTH